MSDAGSYHLVEEMEFYATNSSTMWSLLCYLTQATPQVLILYESVLE